MSQEIPAKMSSYNINDLLYFEECRCGALCGGKKFTDEEEFDNHPDRDSGYDYQGVWWCKDCEGDGDEEEVYREFRKDLAEEDCGLINANDEEGIETDPKITERHANWLLEKEDDDETRQIIEKMIREAKEEEDDDEEEEEDDDEDE
jgi:hypothetical protein